MRSIRTKLFIVLIASVVAIGSANATYAAAPNTQPCDVMSRKGFFYNLCTGLYSLGEMTDASLRSVKSFSPKEALKQIDIYFSSLFKQF